MLYLVGHYGYGWSSAVIGSNTCFLHFNNSEVLPQRSHYRALGIQVRCLQE